MINTFSKEQTIRKESIWDEDMVDNVLHLKTIKENCDHDPRIPEPRYQRTKPDNPQDRRNWCLKIEGHRDSTQ